MTIPGDIVILFLILLFWLGVFWMMYLSFREGR